MCHVQGGICYLSLELNHNTNQTRGGRRTEEAVKVDLRGAMGRFGLIVRIDDNNRYKQQIEIEEDRSHKASAVFLQERILFLKKKKMSLEIYNIKRYTNFSRNTSIKTFPANYI